MKLLLLTPQLPWPPQQGTAIRNFNLIDQLARRHTIDLLTFLAPGEALDDRSPLHELCRRVAAVPQPLRPPLRRARDTALNSLPDMALRLESDAMRAQVQAWVRAEAYDIVQAEGIEMARYGIQASADGRARFLYDAHNAEYLLQERNARTDLTLPARWHAAGYSLVQARKLRAYEARVCRRAAAVLAVSGPDADALRALAPEASVTVISNGIDLDYYAPSDGADASAPPAPLLVFTGKMDYRPNIDAMLWFGSAVFPRILARREDVRLQIVGRNPHPRLDVLRENPAVEITGAVDDVRPYMHGAGVYVIPLRVGGGTRFKALEAMAAARPIVSTSLGVEGIGVRHGNELLLADTPDAFTDAALTLLEPGNEALRHHLGENARRFAEAHYGWEPIVERLDALYQELFVG
jgi:polysaccharide biosynthesis protein PslH